MKKTKIVILFAILTLALALMGVSGCKKSENGDSAGAEQTEKAEQNPEEKNDANSEETEDNNEEEKAEAESVTSAETQEQNGVSASQEEKVYTPTFMYFVSDSDEKFSETNEVIERLKNEYNGKVNFDIRNVDQDPAQLDNFPVGGQTPVLIMLNTSNDISDFLFQNGNYDDLKAAIEAAFK